MQQDNRCSQIKRECKKHGKIINYVNLKNNLEFDQRLLCEDCTEQSNTQLNIIHINQIQQQLQDIQGKREENQKTECDQISFNLNESINKIQKIQKTQSQGFKDLLSKLEVWNNKIKVVELNKELSFDEQIKQYILYYYNNYNEQWKQEQMDELKKPINIINQSYYLEVKDMIYQQQQNICQLETLSIKNIFEQQQQEIQNHFNYIQSQNNDVLLQAQCSDHKKQISFIDLSKGINKIQRPLCEECKIKGDKCYTSLKFIKKLNSMNRTKNQQFNEIKSNYLNQLNQIEDVFQKYYPIQKQQLISIFQLLDKQRIHLNSLSLNNIKNQKNNINIETIQNIAQELSEYDINKPFNQLEIINQIQNEFIIELTSTINQIKQLQYLYIDKYQSIIKQNKQFNNIEELESLRKEKNELQSQIKQLLGQHQQTETQQIQNQIDIQNQPKYKNIECISVFQTNQLIPDVQCFAYAFNKDATLLACAVYNQIIIFDIKDENFNNQLTILNSHTSYVIHIEFSKKSNYFISAGADNSIIYWQEDQLKWKGSQKYQIHTDWIRHILLNKQETELLSCSDDNSIQIWQIDQQLNILRHLYQLENKHNDQVLQLSLNSKEDLLLSTSKDKQIILWKKDQKDKIWKYFQSLQNQYFSYRISFLNDEQFAIQPEDQGVLIIFSLNNDKCILQNNISLKLKNGCNDYYQNLMYYNQEMKLLYHKHGKYIYIIEQLNTGNFKINEILECDHFYNYGTVSNNFKYLVNWDFSQNNIRLFKFNYQ